MSNCLDNEPESNSLVELRPGLSQATLEEATEYIVSRVDICLDVLGESGKCMFISVMGSRYGLQLRQVPYGPHEFVKALRELLGYSATIFEQRMLEELFGISYPDEAVGECVRGFASVLNDDLATHTFS